MFPSPCFAGPQFDIPCYEFVAAWKEKVDSFMAETKDVLKITSIALAESSFVILSREKIAHQSHCQEFSSLEHILDFVKYH